MSCISTRVLGVLDSKLQVNSSMEYSAAVKMNAGAY